MDEALNDHYETASIFLLDILSLFFKLYMFTDFLYWPIPLLHHLGYLTDLIKLLQSYRCYSTALTGWLVLTMAKLSTNKIQGFYCDSYVATVELGRWKS